VSEKEHSRKLRSRVNKCQLQRKFKPEEYSNDKMTCREIDQYVDYVSKKKNYIDLSMALYLAALNIAELKKMNW
jgi:hypothetical protein